MYAPFPLKTAPLSKSRACSPLCSQRTIPARKPSSTAILRSSTSCARFFLDTQRRIPLYSATSEASSYHLTYHHHPLPFAPDDPLYGQGPPGEKDALFLGQMALQGERNLLKIPYSFLVRLRYNPFYALLEERMLEWFENP